MYKEFIEDAENFGKDIQYKIDKLGANTGETDLPAQEVKFKLAAMSSQIERVKAYKTLGNALACPICYIRSGIEESLKAFGSPSPRESKFRCGSCRYAKTIFSTR